MEAINVQALSELLKQPDEESESEDEDFKPAFSSAKLGPGDVGPKPAKEKNEQAPPKTGTKDIWDEEEIQPGAEFGGDDDPRPQPEYDIMYKQAITSEDMYLQMGNKTPATSSCEDMVVKIKLPSTKFADISLDVKPKFLDCRSPTYRLALHLPHPVDSDNGKAQWDGKTETLVVTLRMKRDFDLFNF